MYLSSNDIHHRDHFIYGRSCSFIQTERLHVARGNSLTCPECRTLSKGSPDSFKVCRLAKALQEALHPSKGTGMLRRVQADQCENR